MCVLFSFVHSFGWILNVYTLKGDLKKRKEKHFPCIQFLLRDNVVFTDTRAAEPGPAPVTVDYAWIYERRGRWMRWVVCGWVVGVGRRAMGREHNASGSRFLRTVLYFFRFAPFKHFTPARSLYMHYVRYVRRKIHEGRQQRKKKLASYYHLMDTFR